METLLAKVTRAERLLALVASPAEAKKISDIAHAAKVFALRQKATEAANYAHSIEIEAMRVMGRFLQEGPKNPGTRISGGTISEPPETPTLASMGISKKESAQAQWLQTVAQQKPEVFQAIKENRVTITRPVTTPIPALTLAL